MADLRGVGIRTGKIGANTLGGGDGISGIIIESPETSSLKHGVVKPVYNLRNVERLGITALHDQENFVNCYRHLREFYRTGREGIKLHVMIVPQGTGMVGMLTDSSETAHDSFGKQLLVQAEGEINLVALATNPLAAPVSLNGINADSYSAIALAHGLTVWADENDMPINVLLEGRDYSGNAASSVNLRGLPNLDALHTSLVIGQDWKYADTLPVNNGAETPQPVYMRNFADVGTALGVASIANVNQNIGENESFNLTDATRDAWMIAGLSNHVKIKDQFSDLQTLEDKGYIFGVTYTGLEGVRFNSDHTCSEVVIDAEGNINEHTIGYGRTINKAKRELRRAYLPWVKRAVALDPATGQIAVGARKTLDDVGNTVLSDMFTDSEISDGLAVTDPESDLIGAKVLNISFRVVPTGSLDEFQGEINLQRRIN